MSGGEISDNTTSGNNSNGGGVYISGDGDFTMTGGKISDNTATDTSTSGYTGHGGGIYVESGGGVTMSGGEISGNTAFGNGNGVYVKVSANNSSPFIMSARAVVAQDVYMASGKTICVSAEMELPEGFTHSATIMGDNADEGTVVLTGVPTYVLKTADISKFVFDKGVADGLMEVVPGSDGNNTGVIGSALVG
jgi:hypothetical protein